ncbi:MAG: hypothetical protein JW819_04560 [Candidatus Krumholzibacteriota bacterium]|nr:hypothetical protein [Candidatus Krumholzibacteriota bacterium]
MMIPSRTAAALLLALVLATLAAAAPAAAGDAGFRLADAGLYTPESVLHDPVADVYLVANIAGHPLQKDGNGFISRVSPAGAVLALRWIDGAADSVDLNAPKGMAIAGDSLWVADIDVLRAFHRVTGAPLAAVAVPDAVFLNDVALAADGAIVVSDSHAGGLWRLAPDGAVSRFGPEKIGSFPNGLAAAGAALWVAVAKPDRLIKLDAAGKIVATVPMPAGGLDGLVLLEDGTLLVSSWDKSAVYRLGPERRPALLFEELASPADIGFDAKRRRVLVPLFRENGLAALPLP